VRGAERIWAHATFDIPILGSAYRMLEQEVPWKFRGVRDLRTLSHLAEIRGANLKEIEKGLLNRGVKHNALEDARYQVRVLWELMKSLRK
jgi:hypothetical protein